MTWRKRVLWGAALALLASCGVSEDEAVRLREGYDLADAPYCTSLGCPDVQQYCVELFFEFGRSPALCVGPRICERLECEKEGRVCAVFDGFPGQVKCIEP